MDLHPHDMAILFTGDSMEPMYKDGDIVLVKTGYDNINGNV
ncbi:S24 family peptidase [Peptostreptococcus anaerobius]